MQTLGVFAVRPLRKSKSAPWMLVGVAQLAGDLHRRRLEADLAAVVAAEARDKAALADRDAVEPLEKIDVEEGAAELAVGDALKADLLLPPGGFGDALVLDRAQILGRDPALGAPRPSVEQALRAQQAADMVGAERWLGHRPLLPCCLSE